MKAFVVSILVNGVHDGFLEFSGNPYWDPENSSWNVCRDLVDARLFPEDDKCSVEYYAEQYVKYQGSEYSYEIKKVTLTLE